MAFAPIGKTLAVGGWNKVVHIWNGLTNNLRVLGNCPGAVNSIAFSADGSRVAVACGELRVWNLRTGRLQVLGSQNDGITKVAFSPDGTRIASTRILKRDEANGTPDVDIWDLRTGNKHSIGNYGGNWGGWSAPVSFSPDGTQLAAGGGDGVVRIWDPESGRMRSLRIFDRTDDRVESIAFSPDGKRIVAGSGGGDGTLRIVEIER